jgi:hypothetical protein
MSVRVSLGLCRACPQNGAVLLYILGLAYKPSSHAEPKIENKRLVSAIILP